MIRTAWVMTCGALLTIFYGGRILFHSLIGSRKLACVCHRLPRTWARWILRLSGVRVRVEGVENLRRDGAQIVVSNHQSWFDVFALVTELPVEYRFVGKKELAGVPVFGPAWRSCGHISIDRDNRAAALESLAIAGREIVTRELTIVMFPEGTRSPTGRLQSFKKGAFVLAIQAEAPVVPVAVLGTRAIMPKGSWRIRSGEIRVRIGKPIEVEGMRHQDRDRLLRAAWRAVAELKGEEPGTTTHDRGGD